MGLIGVVEKASDFALEVHRQQKRKYTGEPYWYHLREVAMYLEGVGCDPEIVAAGFLHDCVEDQDVTLQELIDRFGMRVARLVDEVTDRSKPSDGNRAVRKRIDREHIARASPDGQSVKLADLLSNTSSIIQYDMGFARIYIPEKRLLLPLLTQGHPKLYKMALSSVAVAERKLQENQQDSRDKGSGGT